MDRHSSFGFVGYLCLFVCGNQGAKETKSQKQFVTIVP